MPPQSYKGVVESIGNHPLLLSANGRIVESEKCISPPSQSYAVWNNEQLLKVLDDEAEYILSEAVGQKHRQRLKSWGWLNCLDINHLLAQLSKGEPIPRPAEDRNLLVLWSLVQQNVRFDYNGHKRRKLAIVPTLGSNVLLPAENVGRISDRKKTISEDTWTFFVNLVYLVDSNWLRALESVKDREDSESQEAIDLLKGVKLDQDTQANIIFEKACESLFCRKDVSLEDHVHIAHLAAVFNTKSPKAFRCLTRDGQQRKLEDGIIATQNPAVEELIPNDWAAAHFLHEAYFSRHRGCTSQQWEEWIKSEKSGFWSFAPIYYKKKEIQNKQDLINILRSRGASSPTEFPYRTNNFYLDDKDFDEKLIYYWTEFFKTDAKVWVRVVHFVFDAFSSYNQNCEASVSQVSKQGKKRKIDTGFIPSAWIVRLRELPCLPDTYDQVRVPADLYLRTPETEPLLSVEHFVKAELDHEGTRDLLCLLGVRNTFAGIGSLLDRIRYIAQSSKHSLCLSEIWKWYWALDKAMARCDLDDADEAREAFINEPLVLTAKHEWVKASDAFLNSSEELPDEPVIEPNLQSLAMWVRLGVADRPTVNHMLDWLKSLPVGVQLGSGTIRRIKNVLKRYPKQVWNTCGHWLALDSTWTPKEQFKFRLTKDSLRKQTELFPAIKSATANLMMLPSEIYDHQPFASLLDLSKVVEYRINKDPYMIGTPQSKPWLSIFASALARVIMPEQTQTERVRRTASLLLDSVWQEFDDKNLIQVTPYIDTAPAGHSYSPDVLWYSRSILVKKGGLARSYDALVAELAGPFADKEIKEAIKICIERDEEFVAEYMEEHFTLDAEIAFPASGKEDDAVENLVLETNFSYHDNSTLTSNGIYHNQEDKCVTSKSDGLKVNMGGSERPGNKNVHRDPDGGMRGKSHPRKGEQVDNGRPTKFISYIGVHPDDAGADLNGMDQQSRMALEAKAIELIIAQDPEWQRTPPNNPGYDLYKTNKVGTTTQWCEVKAMTSSLRDHPVGLSRAQFDYARDKGEAYWLYVVEHADTDMARIVRIQDPAGRARLLRSTAAGLKWQT